MNSEKRRQLTKNICITGVLMAINIVLSSSIFSVPVPGGHFYVNDVIICLSGLILNPFYAFCAGGIGSFLGDLFFYPTPMFVTLVTRTVQVIVISVISQHTFKKKPAVGGIIAVIAGAVIMVAGYTVGRAFIYSTVEYAIIKLPYQILQAAVGCIFAPILAYNKQLKKVIGQ